MSHTKTDPRCIKFRRPLTPLGKRLAVRARGRTCRPCADARDMARGWQVS